MKRIDLGQTITILANVGVLVGIIFLVLEMRQNQQLALAENTLSSGMGRNDVLASINAHPEIWQKGNQGELLSESEKIVYENLLDSYTDIYFFNYFQQRLSGDEPLADTNPAQLAYFLYLNPGAYSTWEELERRTNTSIDALVGAERRAGIGNDYDEFIRAGVARFRELEGQ